MGRPRTDLTGQRAGMLQAVRFSHLDDTFHSHWVCICDCGKELVLQASRFNTRKSCGCLQKKPEGVAAFNQLYACYRSSANSRSLAFELDKEEFRALTSQACSYCGTGPSRLHMGKYHYNGIDRVNSDIGYVTGNCVTSCRECNVAKSDMSPTQWSAWLNRIIEFNTKESA